MEDVPTLDSGGPLGEPEGKGEPEGRGGANLPAVPEAGEARIADNPLDSPDHSRPPVPLLKEFAQVVAAQHEKTADIALDDRTNAVSLLRGIVGATCAAQAKGAASKGVNGAVKLLCSSEKLDLNALRARSWLGLPDTPTSLRAVYWKLLCGVLSPDTRRWDTERATMLATYAGYKKDCFTLMQRIAQQAEQQDARHREAAQRGSSDEQMESVANPSTSGLGGNVAEAPHPLSNDAGWRDWWQAQEHYAAINKDVFRTRSEMAFFLLPPAGREAAASRNVPVIRDAAAEETVRLTEPYRHYDILGRILFIYARLSSMGYIQGMNELLAPLYFVFMSDPLNESVELGEAEVFFCFWKVMNMQQDLFCKELDTSCRGIQQRLAELDDLLERIDPELHQHLKALNIPTQFYAFRWLLLLCTQEFELPEVLRLWDAVLADGSSAAAQPEPPHRDEASRAFIDFLCIAMLIRLRGRLLQGNFSTCMKLLQHYPAYSIDDILNLAIDLRAEERIIAQGRLHPTPEGGRGPSQRDPQKRVGAKPSPGGRIKKSIGSEAVLSCAVMTVKERMGELATSRGAAKVSRNSAILTHDSDDAEDDLSSSLKEYHISSGRPLDQRADMYVDLDRMKETAAKVKGEVAAQIGALRGWFKERQQKRSASSPRNSTEAASGLSTYTVESAENASGASSCSVEPSGSTG